MPQVKQERRLAAILAADIVNYSGLMEADEVGTLATIRILRSKLIEPQIANHRGRIVKLMGDGALCEFASVVDAVACAVAIQKAMAEPQQNVPESEGVRFRIGVNLGDIVVEDDGDLYGDGVNVAARLEQLAEPGGILISGTAYDHLQGKLDCSVSFVGERVLKNIIRPVRVYHVGWQRQPVDEQERLSAKPGLPNLATIAVLPSLDPEDAVAHAILADVLIFAGRPEEGAAKLAAALRINPNHADAWTFLGQLRAFEGSAVEGIDYLRKALRLNPYPPGWYYWLLGLAQYAAGRYEDAADTLRHEATRGLGSQRILAAALAQLGRLDEAKAEAGQFLASHPHFSMQHWADTQPFRHETDRQHFIDGYVKAGLPR
jgi:class 3 adenylate cyclase/Flp pilus assembly protein TadD